MVDTILKPMVGCYVQADTFDTNLLTMAKKAAKKKAAPKKKATKKKAAKKKK